MSREEVERFLTEEGRRKVAQLVAEARQEGDDLDEPDVVHAYLSTACQHALHDACRYFCKYCPAPCSCGCHEGSDGPYPGYDAATEDRLRQALRDAITAAGIEPGPRQAELLVDIVTSVLAGIAKGKA